MRAFSPHGLRERGASIRLRAAARGIALLLTRACLLLKNCGLALSVTASSPADLRKVAPQLAEVAFVRKPVKCLSLVQSLKRVSVTPVAPSSRQHATLEAASAAARAAAARAADEHAQRAAAEAGMRALLGAGSGPGVASPTPPPQPAEPFGSFRSQPGASLRLAAARAGGAPQQPSLGLFDSVRSGERAAAAMAAAGGGGGGAVWAAPPATTGGASPQRHLQQPESCGAPSSLPKAISSPAGAGAGGGSGAASPLFGSVATPSVGSLGSLGGATAFLSSSTSLMGTTGTTALSWGGSSRADPPEVLSSLSILVADGAQQRIRGQPAHTRWVVN